jgi:membrane protein
MWPRLRIGAENWLFDGTSKSIALRLLRPPLRYLYALVRDLLGGQLTLHAMSLVYATLLAVVPLLAFSFAIVRLFGAHRELEPVIFEFFRPMGAAAATLTQKVMDFAESVRAGLVGSVGLALLIWTLLGALKKVEDSLNYVWHVSVSRSFARRIAEYLGLLVIGPMLVVAVIGLSQYALRHSGLVGLNALALALAPFAIVTILFTLVYALAPNTRVRWRSALYGGVAASVLWTLTGKVFTTLVVTSARMNMVYAGLAIIVAALVWTYVGWLILLLGAQLSFYVQNPSYLRMGLNEPRLSNNDMEQLTLSIMYLVGERHQRGGPRWSCGTLSNYLKLPGVMVARCAQALEDAGLVINAEDETIVPARDLTSIRVVDVLGVARTHSGTALSLPWQTPTKVAAVCAELDAGWRAQCGDRTLLDILS